ncbi:hypothetical protein L596_027025 [Steinernema carpocapsae]|uniref:Uncharacterized protein n=1 Tax=Steinernema carpocapsae TaxID=34508 RepID=A0A4U5M355_STECR|nr:hypothetical protein L596_027025 [Steinernema carpocapsae]
MGNCISEEPHSNQPFSPLSQIVSTYDETHGRLFPTKITIVTHSSETVHDKSVKLHPPFTARNLAEQCARIMSLDKVGKKFVVLAMDHTEQKISENGQLHVGRLHYVYFQKDKDLKYVESSKLFTIYPSPNR